MSIGTATNLELLPWQYVHFARRDQSEKAMTVSEQLPCAIVAISAGACRLGQRLALEMGADFFSCKGEKTAEIFQQIWPRYRALICIMASGIVIRSIAPLLVSKYQDPAVLLCDEKGQYVVSLLSGHLGGANALARHIASLLGAQAVISTASDVLGRTALDLWCREQGLVPADIKKLTRAMAKLVDQGWLTIASDGPLPELPPDLRPVLASDHHTADLFVSIHTDSAEQAQKYCLLHPKDLAIGIGCNRGTDASTIASAIHAACDQHHLAVQSIACLASIELKQDEAGLLDLAASWQLPLVFYSAKELNQVPDISASPVVFRHTGARAVAEPAALLAAGDQARLLVAKIKQDGVTIAIASS